MSMQGHLSDLEARLVSLRASGAAQGDAVAWHHIETLAARTRQHHGPVQDLLCHKLAQALDRFQDRWASAPAADHAAQIQHRERATSPLADLLHRLRPPGTDADGQDWGQRPPERARIRQFRQQLGQLSVQKKVNQALAQAPQNAGPINSHMLVLRSLGLMRDVSPPYLNRFMAHVETLLCLEQAGHSRSKARTAAPSEPGQ